MTGEYRCTDDQTGGTYASGRGWSGQGVGWNNPTAQNMKDRGPIPRGCWKVAGVTGSKGPTTIVLEPLFSSDPTNNNRDLSTFRIHGASRDPETRALSSEGCIIMGPTDREKIATRIGEIICVY